MAPELSLCEQLCTSQFPAAPGIAFTSLSQFHEEQSRSGMGFKVPPNPFSLGGFNFILSVSSGRVLSISSSKHCSLMTLLHTRSSIQCPARALKSRTEAENGLSCSPAVVHGPVLHSGRSGSGSEGLCSPRSPIHLPP